MADSSRQTNAGVEQSDTLLSTLKNSTREQHLRLHDIVGSLAMLDSLEHYSAALQRYHLAVSSVESAAKSYLARRQLTDAASLLELDWDARLVKADWIECDLENLASAPLPAGSVGDISLDIYTQGELVGATYVVEGMTLGGRQMLKALSDRFGEKTIDATNFFGSYGQQIGLKWSEWKSWAIQQNVSADEAVAAAIQTFRLFEKTLDHHGASDVSSKSILDGPPHP